MSLLTHSLSDRNRKTLIKTNNIRKKFFRTNEDNSSGQFLLDALWRETQQLMERSEQLVRLITHVCTQNLSGVVGTPNSCPRLHLECSSSLVVPGEDTIVGGGTRERNALPKGEETSSERGGGEEDGVPSFERRISYSEELRPREGKLHLTSHPNSQNNRFPSSGLRGSGAGPPIRETAKRKESHPAASSWTYPLIRPSFKTSISAFLLLVSFLAGVTESCSSRSTPKPRPASATLRPNVTFPTYACPPAYAAWFCLNGATCFTVKIQDAILYNCECAEGYMGPRCEFKDLDGSYLPARERVLLETASIAGGACIAIVLVFVVLFAMYVFLHKDREKRRNLDNPYYDKKPLRCSSGSDFICTITPLHITHTHPTKEPTIQIKWPDKEEKCRESGELYLVKEVDRTVFCTCEQRDGSGHVLCANHFPKFIVPNTVPKYV